MSKHYEQLVDEIKKTYEAGVSLDDAERLAAKALFASEEISRALKEVDLDSRMRKSGVKAVKATVRTNEISKHDKKPAEGVLEDVVSLDATVGEQQDALDRVEVDKAYLERSLDISSNAHIFFRGVSKGRFDT